MIFDISETCRGPSQAANVGSIPITRSTLPLDSPDVSTCSQTRAEGDPPRAVRLSSHALATDPIASIVIEVKVCMTVSSAPPSRNRIALAGPSAPPPFVGWRWGDPVTTTNIANLYICDLLVTIMKCNYGRKLNA